MDKNTTHLAGEFLVAGELSRRGYPVSITMGNAKSVDIIASTSKGEVKIDAKAGRAKGNWPIRKDSVSKDMFYIFVHLKTEKQILNNEPPEYFVVPGEDIIKKKLVKIWNTRQGVKYLDVCDEYRERWELLEKHP